MALVKKLRYLGEKSAELPFHVSACCFLSYVMLHTKSPEGRHCSGSPPTAMVTLLKSADDSGWCRTCQFITLHFVVKCFLGFTRQGLYFLQIWGQLYLHCLGILVLWPAASFGWVGWWGLCRPSCRPPSGMQPCLATVGTRGSVWEVWEPLLG